jgi:hypothetical protein
MVGAGGGGGAGAVGLGAGGLGAGGVAGACGGVSVGAGVVVGVAIFSGRAVGTFSGMLAAGSCGDTKAVVTRPKMVTITIQPAIARAWYQRHRLDLAGGEISSAMRPTRP